MYDSRPVCYIPVDVRIHADGRQTPLCLWYDRKPYHISKVIHEGPGYSVAAGRNCQVFDCLIQGRRRLLYWDGKSFFLERRKQ